MLTRFARHQFQNAKVAPHPSVNIWQIANHSIWHKEHLFFCFFGGLVYKLSLQNLDHFSSSIYYYYIINISSCSQKYCLYIFCFKRVDGGCEDTYNDNLWGTNCNNFVDSLACSEGWWTKIALITWLQCYQRVSAQIYDCSGNGNGITHPQLKSFVFFFQKQRLRVKMRCCSYIWAALLKS